MKTCNREDLPPRKTRGRDWRPYKLVARELKPGECVAAPEGVKITNVSSLILDWNQSKKWKNPNGKLRCMTDADGQIWIWCDGTDTQNEGDNDGIED